MSVTVTGIRKRSSHPVWLTVWTFTFLTFSLEAGVNQWTSLGLEGKAVTQLVVSPRNPRTIYAVAAESSGSGEWAYGPGRLFRSTDGGQTWVSSDEGLTQPVRSVAIDPTNPDIVYAGSGWVRKSMDGGVHWAPTAQEEFCSVTNITVDPVHPSTVFAVRAVQVRGVDQCTHSPLSRSNDAGSSWIDVSLNARSLSTCFNSVGLNSLNIDPSNTATLYVKSLCEIFKSPDDGSSWRLASFGLGSPDQFRQDIRELALASSNPKILYAMVNGEGIYKSIDGGDHWRARNRGITDFTSGSHWEIWGSGGHVYDYQGGGLVVHPANPDIVYVGTHSGVYRTNDGGDNWEAVNVGLTDRDIWSLAIDPLNPHTLYAGTASNGVFTISFGSSSCTPLISPRSQSVPPDGGAAVISLSTGACSWTGVSQVPWVTVTSGSEGIGNGTIQITAQANPDPSPRSGTVLIASQTFTVNQDGGSPCTYAISSSEAFVDPGGGSIYPANVQVQSPSGCVWAASSSVPWISILTGNEGSGNGTVTYHVAGNTAASWRTGTLVIASQIYRVSQESGLSAGGLLSSPIVLSANGLNNSFFTSELTLTNRSRGDATVLFTYNAFLGSGSGQVSAMVGPGRQLVVPDAIEYLRSLGLPIPDKGDRGGILQISALGYDAAVTVRTTTRERKGRAGLSYPGMPFPTFTKPFYICGLRQNSQDRSNLALQSFIYLSTFRITVFSNDGSLAKVLPDITVPEDGFDPPQNGFYQISGILHSNGLALESGYVRIEQVGGNGFISAYGVINDQSNSDGSMIFPFYPTVPAVPDSLLKTPSSTLPVVVEAIGFTTELVLTNLSEVPKLLNFEYVAESIQTADHTARFNLLLNPGEQKTIPDLVQYLRDLGLDGIGPSGPTYAGALFMTAEDGDVSNIFLGARTSVPGDGGRYGLFYTAVPYGAASLFDVWIDSLRQDEENRTNLALVNTGEADSSDDVFSIDLYDGETGQLANTVEGIVVRPRQWLQIGNILAQYAPKVRHGYARIHLTSSGWNPFIAYAVINDGAHPGERTGDGAYITSAP